MRTQRIILGLLLFLSCSAVGAEYAAVDQIVYRVSDENGNAWVHNIFNTSGTVTIPAYVTYRGVKYKVTGITKNDFDTSTRNTYNFSSAILGSGLITGLVTLDAAAREREEKPFRYDYDYTRSTIKTLNLPNTLEFIDEKAFDGMRSLKSLTIPASVKYLPDDGVLSSNSVFGGYLPNLQNITILGLPEFEAYEKEGKRTITLTSQDKNGNFDYLERIKEKFDLSYCRNLVSFSMPEYEKRLPLVKEFHKANTILEARVNSCNSALKKGLIPIPALKDEACTDAQTIQDAYNQAFQYINTMFNCCKSQEQLYDSLTNLLKQHPYYDGSKLPYEIPVLDPQEPQNSSIPTLSKKIKAKMLEEYTDLVNGNMERNLQINHPDKYNTGYIANYIAKHPEKKEFVDRLYLDFRCEDEKTRRMYIKAYLEKGTLSRTCRQSQWTSYSQLFDSQEEFDKLYDKAISDSNFKYEILRRENAFQKLSELKSYVANHSKKINLSNINKKPSEETSEVVKILRTLKSTHFYDRAVSYLISALPKIQKEYEKNGQYFKSEIEFFETYTSDSYSQILKANKKK